MTSEASSSGHERVLVTRPPQKFRRRHWFGAARYYTAVGISQLVALTRPTKKNRSREILPPKRILVVRVDHIGDAILTIPALAALRKAFPAAEITVASGSWSLEVFRQIPNIDQVVVVDCPWWVRKRSGRGPWQSYLSFLRSVLKLRRKRYDLMIDFRGDPRHVIWFGVITRARRLAGISRLGTRSLLDVASSPGEGDHEIDRSLSVVQALGGPPAVSSAALPINDDDRRLAASFIPQHGRFLVLHTGGKLINRWPFDRFAALLRRLLVLPDLSFVIIGGTEDREEASKLAELDPTRIHIAAGRLSIPSVAALVESAALYVGVDSGPMHVLHAVTTPAVLLFGPTSPARFAPRRSGISIIAAAQCCSEELHEVCLHCCEGGWSACMESLALETVLDTALQALSSSADKRRE